MIGDNPYALLVNLLIKKKIYVPLMMFLLMWANSAYSATIVTMTGLADRTGAMWIVAGMMGGGLIGLALGLALVERIGRRPLVLISLMGVALSLFFVAIVFTLAHVHSPAVEMPAVDPECDTATYVS